jgi:hypothetical protein
VETYYIGPDIYVKLDICMCICATRVPLKLQGFQNCVCHFCSLKFDQAMHWHWSYAQSFFRSTLRLSAGVPNKDLTVLLTGASLPTPVSHPPLGGSCRHSVRCTRPSKPFKLCILVHTWSNFYLQKMHPLFWNTWNKVTQVAQVSGRKSVRSHLYQCTKLYLQKKFL